MEDKKALAAKLAATLFAEHVRLVDLSTEESVMDMLLSIDVLALSLGGEILIDNTRVKRASKYVPLFVCFLPGWGEISIFLPTRQSTENAIVWWGNDRWNVFIGRAESTGYKIRS